MACGCSRASEGVANGRRSASGARVPRRVRLAQPPFTLHVPSLVVPWLVVAASASCGGSPSQSGAGFGVVQSSLSRDTSPQVLPGDLVTVATDNTKFAFDFYHALTAGDETSNVFYSPYCVSIALAMTYAGAQGETAQQMASTLDLELPPAKLHPAFNALDLALASRAQGQSGADGQPFKLNIVNSLWGDKTLSFQKSFLDTLAVNYGAGVRVVDFLHTPDAARVTINNWVASETDDLIENLLPESSISMDTVFVLVDAIDFSAGWAAAFEASSTQPGSFHRLDGSTTQPPMMSDYLETTYASGSNWQAVELPYAGRTTSMLLIVPQAGQFAAVESSLTADFVNTVVQALAVAGVTVTMPKFTIQGATKSLKAELTSLGMVDAFSDSADFSGITSAPVYLSDVLQQAYIEVDETGTKAAAATAVIGEATAALNNNATVTVDRPFFAIIRDNPTGTVLFVARVLDPQD
jgi:serpin B